tara:strand:+ start:1838 stop:2080 length:243 start_codon:yes stop_codon:yes gene_type:complete
MIDRTKETINCEIPNIIPFVNKYENPYKKTDSLNPVSNIRCEINKENKPKILVNKVLSKPKKAKWFGREKGHLSSNINPL